MSAGVRFKLGAAPLWFGIPAADLVDRRILLDELSEQIATELRKALGKTREPKLGLERLEDALIEIGPKQGDAGPCMSGVVDLLQQGRFTDGKLLQGLQRLTNLSERSVRRETKRVFGFGPKMLERIVRLQHFLNFAQKRRGDGLASLAAAAGYADQAHLSRDARGLTGMTPKTLFDFCAPELCH